MAAHQALRDIFLSIVYLRETQFNEKERKMREGGRKGGRERESTVAELWPQLPHHDADNVKEKRRGAVTVAMVS